MTVGEDLWVCETCRSINMRRSDHCYKCHAPRLVAEVDPHDLPSGDHPVEAQPAAVSPYRPSRQRAIAAGVLILGAAAASIVGWIGQSRAILVAIEVEKEAPPPTDPSAAAAHATGFALDAIMPISHLQVSLTTVWIVLAVAALVAWAAWLSRVVDNLPALGLGYSRVSPQIAFVENFLMGRNLYSMPARVREVTQKLHPAGGGDGILALAWLTLFGSVIAGRVGFYFARLLAGSEADYLRARIVIGGLTTVLAFVGYVLVVGVIIRVERLSDTRAAAVAGSQAAEPHPTAAPPAAQREPASSFAGDRTAEFLAQRAAAAHAPSGDADPHRGDDLKEGETSPDARTRRDEPGPRAEDPV